MSTSKKEDLLRTINRLEEELDVLLEDLADTRNRLDALDEDNLSHPPASKDFDGESQ